MGNLMNLRAKMEWEPIPPGLEPVKVCGAFGSGDLWVALVYEVGGSYYSAVAPFAEGDGAMSPVPRTSLDAAAEKAVDVAKSLDQWVEDFGSDL